MKYLKSFNESNNIKVINNLQELSEYIEEYYPNIWNLVHGSAHTAMEVLGSDIEDDDE